jgi:hypothetical protein
MLSARRHLKLRGRRGSPDPLHPAAARLVGASTVQPPSLRLRTPHCSSTRLTRLRTLALTCLLYTSFIFSFATPCKSANCTFVRRRTGSPRLALICPSSFPRSSSHRDGRGLYPLHAQPRKPPKRLDTIARSLPFPRSHSLALLGLLLFSFVLFSTKVFF